MSKGKVEVYLLRHADAGDPQAWRAPDSERPLSPKGTRQAERLGRFLAAMGFRPARIVSSPKVRARQTADIVASAVGATVILDDRLAEGFDLARLRALIAGLGGGGIVLVGHDPDFSSLLAELVGASNIPLPKGALARIDLDGPATRNGGTLRWLVPADALKPAG
jgi:phosphohistidine phosphatase